ncbi:MAG: peroxiredoxin [Burkholderiales bacterium]
MPVPRTLLLVSTLALVAVVSAHAALKPGDSAPEFTAEVALAGNSARFTLSQALQRGPVVLYFFPKAFTSGCTVEAHQFAEATPQFEALGATVVGMSNDDIGTLKKFSVEACRNKFAVAADPGARTAKQYDATLALLPGVADRITYVIGRDGKVSYTFASLSPDGHVENALKAVAALKKAAAPR